MELHTLGVDGGYTQKDVQEVARAFTGWTIANPRQGGGFHFDPRRHDDGEKIVLGQRIKAGGGQSDGDAILDLLARHPSTARFIATKLARRFVADDPPAALVDRAARRFKDTDGDIREVVRTIVTSPEFLGDGYRAQRPRTRSSSSSARSAPPAWTSRTRCRWCSRCATWACRSMGRSRRPGTPTGPTPGSIPARCSVV